MTQAERIITKFGGVRQFAQALQVLPDPEEHRHWSVIYRWQWSGRIPSTMWPAILKAARLNGILLTDEEMSPR